jgi:citrate synthase
MSEVTIRHGDKEMTAASSRPPRETADSTSRRCGPTLGLVTLDRGFGNTAESPSTVSYIDGEEGSCCYRGYPIEQLAEHSTLPRGVLPPQLRRAAHAAELDEYEESITRTTRCCART